MIFASRRRRTLAGLMGSMAAGVALATLAGPAQATGDARVEAVFQWIDRNHDGRITGAEFQDSIEQSPPPGGVELILETTAPPPPDETREALFRRLDADGDLAVTLGELEAGSRARTVATPALSTADRDQDGALTEGELAAHLTAAWSAAGEQDPSAGAGLLARGVILEHDADEDGKIALVDFRP